MDKNKKYLLLFLFTIGCGSDPIYYIAPVGSGGDPQAVSAPVRPISKAEPVNPISILEPACPIGPKCIDLGHVDLGEVNPAEEAEPVTPTESNEPDPQVEVVESDDSVLPVVPMEPVAGDGAIEVIDPVELEQPETDVGDPSDMPEPVQDEPERVVEPVITNDEPGDPIEQSPSLPLACVDNGAPSYSTINLDYNSSNKVTYEADFIWEGHTSADNDNPLVFNPRVFTIFENTDGNNRIEVIVHKFDHLIHLITASGDIAETILFGNTPVTEGLVHNVTLMQDGKRLMLFLDGTLEIDVIVQSDNFPFHHDVARLCSRYDNFYGDQFYGKISSFKVNQENVRFSDDNITNACVVEGEGRICY